MVYIAIAEDLGVVGILITTQEIEEMSNLDI